MHNTSRNTYENLTKTPKYNISSILENKTTKQTKTVVWPSPGLAPVARRRHGTFPGHQAPPHRAQGWNNRMRGNPSLRYTDVFVFVFQCSIVDMFCWNNYVSSAFLSIHPVQSVINSITQLSGRGFPHIFHTSCFIATLCVLGTSKWKPGLKL